jgi:hypothetical protein
MIATPDCLNFGKANGGFQPIWAGQDLQEFRGRLDSDLPPAICHSCAVYNGAFS